MARDFYLKCNTIPRSDTNDVGEKHWVVLTIPRGDTNEVGKDEVTVTSASGLHKQKGQKNRKRRESYIR